MNNRISQITSLFVIAIGCFVILGWQFDINLLKSGFYGMELTMKPNTALCFLLAGMSLRLLQCQRLTRRGHRVAQGMAVVVMGIGLLTLSQYLFGWNLHIDQLLFQDVVSSVTPYAGRMGANTALNFVLMGLALFVIGRNSQRNNRNIWLAQIFSTIAALISLLALFGYIFEINISLSLIIVTSTQAVHTIITFFVLYIGILWLQPNRGVMQVITSPLIGGLMARWLLPWAIIFPVVTNWLSFQGRKLGWFNSELGYTWRSLIFVITFSMLIWGTARFINQLELHRQQAQKDLTEINETLELRVAERTQDLEKSQARFAGILKIANDAIISVDRNHRITLFNQGAEKIFGYESEEILGQPLDLLLPEQFRIAHQQHISKFDASSDTSGKARRMGERGGILGMRRDGRQFPAEASISKLEIGDEIIFTVILRDISDRQQIEIALQTSEEQFRHSFQYASIGMAILDLNGHWLQVNPALCNIVGYSEAELLALTFQDITHADDVAIDLDNIHNLVAGNIETYQREKRYFHKQGHIVWVQLHGSLVKDNQGHPLHIIAQIQDITKRKESQKTIELQSIIMNNMAGGVCLVKATDLTIVYTNPKFDQIFGYEEGELAGQPVGVINYVDEKVTPDDTVEDVVTQINRDGEAKYEVYNKKKDGTLFWCRVHTSKFEHPEYGTVFVAVQEDITELKLSAKALQDTTNRLNFLLNYSPVVIFSSKPDGDYGATFISENIKDIMGYESKAFLEDSSFWIDHLHPDDVDQLMSGLTNLFTNNFHSQEFRLLHADGSYRWILEQIRLIRDREGNPVEILGYLIDISDRKQTELELKESKKIAEAANQAKSMFLSNMSHELRTPLNAILGFTELMSYDPSLSPENQEDLAIVNRSGAHLLDLINDILDLSKIESGQMKLHTSDFDLDNLLTSIEEMLQVQAKEKGLQLIVERDPDLPKYVQTDEKKLHQVIINLLGNAIKFTKKGTVTLRVKQKGRTGLNQSQLLFEIEDTGVGIAPDEIDGLFQVFVQAQAGNKLNQGTGLGLAISQRFIQLMGSQIHVQSTLHQGSLFYFELTVKTPQIVPDSSASIKQRVIGLAPNQPTYRILVVEDLEENRRLLVKLLLSVGFEVREATQGLEAIAIWESWSPHLIWMDLRMPIMDGYTAIKQIREHPQGQETIIVALTASVFEEEQEKVLMAGCNDFIGKPFQEKVIFEKLTKHLGVKYNYAVVSQESQKLFVDDLSLEDLSTMSPEWLQQMYQAAYYLDTEVMKELIAQIPASRVSLSKSLTNAINNFNSDKVMELIRPLISNI